MNRDKAIIDDLNRFRVMSRNDIMDLYFMNLKNPRQSANSVLKRLHRDGKIQRSTDFNPYVYFGPDISMKKNSAKIGHFLAIVEVYKEILQHGKVDTFQVEPKYGSKGTAEPDIFCIFRKTPFFIEVQKTVYSEKQINEKLDRYVDLYESKIIYSEPWQPLEKKIFPHVLILSDQRFPLDGKYPFKVIQAQTFTQFLQSLKPKDSKTPEPPKIKSSNGSIKVNLG